MVRLFEQFGKRKVTLLDGIWKFKSDPQNLGKDEEWFSHFPLDAVDIAVPSCWNNELGLYSYEGMAWYAREITIDSTCSKLVFHGITGQATIYLDGKEIGSHYGGFTGFECFLENLNPGIHSLVISVDSSLDDYNTITQNFMDWFHYGGINRSVELMALPDLWIDKLTIDYTLSEDLKTASVKAKILLKTAGSKLESSLLNLCVHYENTDNIPIYSDKIEVKGQTSIVIEHTLTDINLWDTDSPNLSTFTASTDQDD